MEENLSIFMFGLNQEGFVQFPEKRLTQKQKDRNPMEGSKDNDSFKKNKNAELGARNHFSDQEPKEFKDTWGYVVVCERHTVF